MVRSHIERTKQEDRGEVEHILDYLMSEGRDGVMYNNMEEVYVTIYSKGQDKPIELTEEEGKTFHDELAHREDSPAVEYCDGNKYWLLINEGRGRGHKPWNL